MNESPYAPLRAMTKKYLSIGVTADGARRRSVHIPWANDANAYNMRTPNIYVSPEELRDERLWTELQRFHIIGCYIFCPLEDYSFLSRMPELEDLTIHKGGALRSLAFLRDMKDWFQLHIEDAVLDNLEDLFPEGRKRPLHSYCVCLSGCEVADISAMERSDVRLSELVILAPQGRGDRDRWKKVRCGKYSYYEYRV